MSSKVELLYPKRTGWRSLVPPVFRSPVVKLLENIIVSDGSNEYMTPAKYVTDGSSWPWITPLNPLGASFEEGGLHDFLYEYRILLDAEGYVLMENVSRKTADIIWFKTNTSFDCEESIWGMFVCAVRHITPAIGYVFLRLFGWYAWFQSRKNDFDPSIFDNEIFDGLPMRYKNNQ